MAPNERFGRLLTEGISSVAGRQKKTVQSVESEIAGELGFTSHNVERWRRGHVPSEPEHVAFLVRYCVTYGRVGRSLAESILTQARYPDREKLLKELFPSSGPSRILLPACVSEPAAPVWSLSRPGGRYGPRA